MPAQGATRVAGRDIASQAKRNVRQRSGRSRGPVVETRPLKQASIYRRHPLPTKKRINHAPDQPAAFEDEDVHAVQALFRGSANDGQQKRAIAWILEQACKVKDLPAS